MITAPLMNPGQIDLPSVGKSLAPPVAPLVVVIKKDAIAGVARPQQGRSGAGSFADRVGLIVETEAGTECGAVGGDFR